MHASHSSLVAYLAIGGSKRAPRELHDKERGIDNRGG